MPFPENKNESHLNKEKKTAAHSPKPSVSISNDHNGDFKQESKYKQQDETKKTSNWNKKFIKEAYAGFEIYYDGHRFVFEISELINIIMEQVQSYSDKLNADSSAIKDKFIKNLGHKDIILGGHLNNWLLIAENLEQINWKDKGRKPKQRYGFMLAGRRLEAFSPADRYIYDRGSEDQFAQQADKKQFSPVAEKMRMPTDLPKINKTNAFYKEYAGFCGQDALPDKYIGYRDIARNFEETALNKYVADFQIASAVRHALIGLEPARLEVKKDANKKSELDSIDAVAVYRKFEAGEIKESEAQKLIYNIFKNGPLLLDRQMTVSWQLTDDMPKSLSVLVGAWFVAEFSRNRSVFTVGKMLLDLIEAEASLSCNDMPITWSNSLCHPEMPLQGAHSVVDPTEELNFTGGLHPMAHKNSYAGEFIGNPFRLDPENLSWAHIKSGVIICEWLSRYLKSRGVLCSILNQYQYRNALNANESKQEQAFKKDINAKRELCYQKFIYSEDPESRERYFSMIEKTKIDLRAFELWLDPYRNGRKAAKKFIAEIFDLLHDAKHEMHIPREYPIAEIKNITMVDKNKSKLTELKIPFPKITEIYSIKQQKRLNSLNRELKKYENRLKIQPYHAHAHYCKGVVLYLLGKTQDAINSFLISLRIRCSAKTYFKCGVALFDLEEYEDALTFFYCSLGMKPKQVDVLYYRGQAELILKLFVDAFESYSLVLKIQPTHAGALAKKAWLIYRFDDFGSLEEALQACEASLLIDPNHIYTLNAQAFILDGLNRKNESAAVFEKLTRINPQCRDTFFNCANVFFKLGCYTKALVYLERSFDIGPIDNEMRQKRKEILSKLNYPVLREIKEAKNSVKLISDAHPASLFFIPSSMKKSDMVEENIHPACIAGVSAVGRVKS